MKSKKTGKRGKGTVVCSAVFQTGFGESLGSADKELATGGGATKANVEAANLIRLFECKRQKASCA